MRIKSSKVWISGDFIPAVIEIENGKITGISDHETARAEDYGDRRILPGFIDIHTHGAFGFSANYSTAEELQQWAKKMPLEGVTAFLPTVFTEKTASMKRSCGAIADAMESGANGAEILGIHLEGPFLNPEYKGAMNADSLQKPSIDRLREFQDSARGNIKYLALAVELDEGFALTRYAVQNGIRVAIGHTAAGHKTTMMGLANGASCFIHAFNAMSPLKHRNSGCAGAMLHSSAFTEAIFDGCHIDPAILNLLFTAKGKDRVIGISDSLALKATPPGEYEFDGRTLVVSERGSAYLKGTNTLAGSTLFFNRGLRYMIEEAMIPVEAAINALSTNAANMLGIGDRKGKICVGYDADLVVLEDDYQVKATYCNGYLSAKQ